MKTFKTIFFVLLISVLILSGCSKKAATEKTVAEEKLTPVQVTEVKLGTVYDAYKFGGTVTARDSVSVLPENSGKIREVLVRVGDFVQKDQEIGKIDPSRAGQNYNLSPVKSPISGTVTQVMGVVGSTTSPAVPFAVVQTLDDLEISFSVIERYVTKVAEGNKATVTFDAFEGEVFDAYISQVNPTLDVATRTLSVKAKLANNDNRVKAGMFARLNVVTGVKDKVVVIPFSSVMIQGDENYVFIVNGDTAVKTSVKTGIRNADTIEIVEGLKVGDKLVTTGQGLLSNGEKVKVIN